MCAIRKECVRHRGLNRSGGGDWRGNSPRPFSVMRGMGGRTAVPSNRYGRQGGCEPATASSGSPRWLASREACCQRPSPLGDGRLSRNDALPFWVTSLTGRHGTLCRGDGSGLLLGCRKAREPLRSKRWLASAAALENTWTRDPGARRADASPPSGVDRGLVYAPASCGWAETVYDAPLCDSRRIALAFPPGTETGSIGAAPQRARRSDLAVKRRACLKFGPSIRRGSPRDPPDRSSL